jgi:hypothetical protein
MTNKRHRHSNYSTWEGKEGKDTLYVHGASQEERLTLTHTAAVARVSRAKCRRRQRKAEETMGAMKG